MGKVLLPKLVCPTPTLGMDMGDVSFVGVLREDEPSMWLADLGECSNVERTRGERPNNRRSIYAKLADKILSHF